MKIAFKGNKILTLGGKTFSLVEGPITIYNVTCDDDGHGSIIATPSSGRKDTLITLSNTPDAQYRLNKYTLDGNDLQGNTFNIQNDCIVKGWFERYIFDISVTQPQNGTVSTNKNSAEAGETVTLSYTADSGYEFQYFTVNGVQIVGNTFTMPSTDVTVSGSFEEMHGGSDVLYTNIPRSLLRDWSNPVVSNFSNTRRYVLFHQVLEWGTQVTTYANDYNTGYYNISWGDTVILNAEQYLSMPPVMTAERLIINGSLLPSINSGSTYKLIYDQVDKMLYLYCDGVLQYSTSIDLSQVTNSISIDSYRASVGSNRAFVYHSDVAVATFDMLNDALSYSPS